MRGLIVIAALLGGLYYLYTETDKLDKPIAETKAQMNKIEQKVESITGTQLIRVDGKVEKLKLEAGQRLSSIELTEFNTVLNDKNRQVNFKKYYCNATGTKHPIFSAENLQFICDNI